MYLNCILNFACYKCGPAVTVVNCIVLHGTSMYKRTHFVVHGEGADSLDSRL